MTDFMSNEQQIVRAADGTASVIVELDGIGSLRGVHNAQNAACATAAALALGLDPPAIQAGLRSFPGLAHRMEEVGRRGAVLFVNDSKATNADSAAQALACFDDIFWIAGGKPKTGGIDEPAEILPAYPQGLSDRRGGAGFCGDARRATCRMRSPERSTRRWPRRPATPKPPPRTSRWSCSRRPAPRSTNIAISRSAATPSGRWCRRCPGWRSELH